MEIIVLVKAVSIESHVNYSEPKTRLESGILKINPVDESAIEKALRIKEATGAQITVVSMGIRNTERLLRNIVAAGADKAVLITSQEYAGSDTVATSRIISRAIEKIGKPDLIMCGRRSVDSETGNIPVQIACFLKMKCLTNVIDLGFNNGTWQLKTLTDEEEQIFEAQAPIVISYADDSLNLRNPTVNQLRHIKNDWLSILTNHELVFRKDEVGILGSATKVAETEIIEYPKKNTIIINDSVSGAHEIFNKIRK